MPDRKPRQADDAPLDITPAQWYALAAIVGCVAVVMLLTR